MKSYGFSFSLTFAGLASLVLTAPIKRQGDSIQGFDISDYQPTVDFASAYGAGARFVMIKATEGTNYISPAFSSQWTGATGAGLIRGGYHFAHPDTSTGAAQAQYFVQNGGGWTNDNLTLPGMLDIEYNPSGDTCYGLAAADMTAWIADFVATYENLTTRYPIIYSTADWWNTCTGGATNFANTCPLDLASYNDSPGSMPGGWAVQTIWQNSDSYQYGGDSDLFNGAMADLVKLASG